MKKIFLSVLLIVVMAFGASTTMYGDPDPIAVSVAASDAINVKTLGAVGDGSTDDTIAFQNAITQSTALKKSIYVPYGEYIITQTLSLSDQLLFGEPSGAWSSDNNTLPTIKQTNVEANAVILNAGGSVSGLNFRYDNNMLGTPIQYAPTILLNGVGTRVSNIKIYGSWIGIDSAAGANTGRVVIEDIFISCAAYMGIRLDGGWDASTLHNIEVWAPGSIYNGYFGANGIGIQLEHNDGLRMSNTFVYGAGTGILIKQTGANGVWGNLTNVSTDFCAVGLRMLGTHHVTINGGSLWSHYTGLHLDGEYNEVNVVGTDIRSNGASAVLIDHSYAVNITGCNITRTYDAFEAPAVNIQGASYVVLDGNHLNAMAHGIVVGSQAYSVIITSNIINVTDNTGIGIVQQNPPCVPVVANNIIV